MTPKTGPAIIVGLLAMAAIFFSLAHCTPAHAADTIKAVRADMATAALNQAQVDKAQTAAAAALEARVKALEASVAALTAQPASQAPATSTAQVSTCPKGVSLAGLCDLYAARPGLVRPTTKTLTANKPLGFGVIVGNSIGFAPQALADYDASGFEVYLNGGEYALDNLSLAKSPGLYTLAVGHGNGLAGGSPAQVRLTNSVVDETNANTNYGSVVVGAGSKLTANGVSFLHASVTHLNLFGDSVLNGVFIDSPGQNQVGAHTEGIHVFQGAHLWGNLQIDTRNMAGKGVNATGLIYLDAANGDVDVTINRAILIGAFDIGIYAPIQLKAPRPDTKVRLHMIDVVMQPGNSPNPAARYVFPAGGDVKADCLRCRDAATGDIIDQLVNSQTP